VTGRSAEPRAAPPEAHPEAAVRAASAGGGATDTRLAAALERVAQAVRVLRWDAAHARGLSPAQLSVLEILATAPPHRRRIGALAAELDLSPPTVSDAVAALRRKGLVTTESTPGRGKVLALTDEGSATLVAVGRWDQPLVDAVAALPPGVPDAALVAMLDVVAHLQRAGVVTVARMCTTCRFFERTGGVPRCNLLQAPLPPAALRVDCPEHESAA
jgi:DNA-binding MarR family transcriptional regulator